MKKRLWVVVPVGVVVLLVAFFRFTSGAHLVVANSLQAPARVNIATNVGEVYESLQVAANGSVAIDLAGRDKLLWLIATLPDGRRLESNRLYVTSRVKVSALIGAGGITIDYAP